MTDGSLFERLGGAETLNAVVKDHYDRVVRDPELAPFFEGVDMDRLVQMQFQFAASAFGGPVYYTGPELTAAHQKHGIDANGFAKFCAHFSDALEAAGVAKPDIDAALRHLATYKSTITGESNG